MALKQVTLWSWLTKSEVKTEIYCPSDLRVSVEEFAAELDAQVKNDRLPAQAELCEINWDDTNTKQNRILVRHTGNNTSTDVLQILVGLDQMGNYAYVEEKVLLRPPMLPKIPRDKKPSGTKPSDLTSRVGFIVAAILIGLGAIIDSGGGDDIFLPICVGTGFLIVFVAFLIHGSYDSDLKRWKAVESWNIQAIEEQEAWNKTWNGWRKETFEVAYLASTDDIFGRFTLAVSSTVKQVIKKLFEDRQAELRDRKEKQRTEKEIEQELEKRRQEFK